MKRHLGRILLLLALSVLALQLVFALRVALMILIDPQSTTFQRSEAWRLLTEQHRIAWSQDWVDDSRLSVQLKRAVIASEDAGFVDHPGFEWEAIERAWQRNQQRPKRVVGGSTITQQLAKNLFLSGERNVARKAQELVIALLLETLLGKERILEIYLNNVEWGEGLFGAQAASRHYFRVDAARLSPAQAARLAVMLPAPKTYERRPGSGYIAERSGTILARMSDVKVPK
jgi:monofunctional biosynthetic peptidoglycan transglycosylase